MPKIVDHSQKREEILSLVSRLILRGSLSTAGLREIATAAKVSVGSISHYFGAKEELYDALVVRAGERTNWHLRKAIGGVTGKNAKLTSLFRYALANEDELLIQILIIADAARARAPQAREKRANRLRSEEIYFEVLLKDIQLSRSEARFVITYLIGMLTRRLWTGRLNVESEQLEHLLLGLTEH